jgi:hypothetical protein
MKRPDPGVNHPQKLLSCACDTLGRLCTHLLDPTTWVGNLVLHAASSRLSCKVDDVTQSMMQSMMQSGTSLVLGLCVDARVGTCIALRVLASIRHHRACYLQPSCEVTCFVTQRRTDTCVIAWIRALELD